MGEQNAMGSSARVLVVGHDATELNRLSDILAGRGYESLPARNPDEAVGLAARKGADVVIIHANGKPADAESLAHSFKAGADTARIPVILIGGDSAAADSVLPPGFGDAELFGRLDSLVRLNTMRDELTRRFATTRRYGVDGPSLSGPPEILTDLRVLAITGDKAEAGRIVDAYLDSAGVVVAGSAFNALQVLARDGIDAVVVGDLGDPLAPLTFCCDLRANTRFYHLPVVVLIEPGAFDDGAGLFARGANGVLRRPWQPEDLRSHTRALARQYRYRCMLQDVYREARHFATSDALTGLYSHGFLFEHLGAEIADARRQGRPLTVGLFDIAGMKEINRRDGYAGGDRLLRQVGSLIGRLVRGEDLTARYAGTEFCIVLPNTSPDMGFYALHRLASVIEHTEFYTIEGGEPAHVRLRMGAAGIEPSDTPETLIHRARANMA